MKWVMLMDIEVAKKLRNEFKKLLTDLTIAFPFVSSLLLKARVVAIDMKYPAGVTKDNTKILLSPKFLEMSYEEKLFVLAHEALHWGFFDPQRGEAVENHELYAVVCDCINNAILQEQKMFRNIDWGKFVTPSKISMEIGVNESEIRKMTKEELYKLIIRKFREERITYSSFDPFVPPDIIIVSDLNRGRSRSKGIGGGGMEDNKGQCSGMEKRIGYVINEGSRELYEKIEDAIERNDREALREAIKEAVASAYVTQKMAGSVPAGLERMVNEFLKSKVNWRVLLRRAVKGSLGQRFPTWRKVNRLYPYKIPGYRRLTIPRLIIGVDTSGSISEKELTQALSEIFAIAKEYDIDAYVIPWDAKAYEVQRVDSPEDVKRLVMKGGGGTVISSFLRKAEELVRYGDIMIIFTDGYWWDEGDVMSLFRRVRTKIADGIIVTTGKKNNIPGWREVFIEP